MLPGLQRVDEAPRATKGTSLFEIVSYRIASYRIILYRIIALKSHLLAFQKFMKYLQHYDVFDPIVPRVYHIIYDTMIKLNI